MAAWTECQRVMVFSYNIPRMMYTATSAARIRIGVLESELWKACALHWKVPCIDDGKCSC